MTPDALRGYLPAEVVDSITTHSLEQIIRAAYRQGYADHAAARQHWQDTHGAYRVRPGDLDIDGNVYLLVNQHGRGENP